MNYIIKISTDEGQPKYVERMNGDIRAPNLTEDVRRARQYPESKALEYLEKVRGFISKEKGGESVTAELEAVVVYEPYGGISGQAPQTSEHGPDYIEGWGDPHGSFAFGKVRLLLYMHIDKEGRLSYAYTAPDGEIAACNHDGAAIINAFCVAARDYGVQKIAEYEARKNG